jgi:hypothetical protein
MDITVHTVTFNEELMMQFFIDHYRSRFPNCHIVVYDNKSTDKTVEICVANNCEMRPYDTGGVMCDETLWHTKNSCWKDAKTDWVLVCDTDELLDMNEQQLIQEDADGITLVPSEAWQMVNMEDNLDLHSIKYGWRDAVDYTMSSAYDKNLLFNKKYVDVNYRAPGCHYSTPLGTVKNSKPYRMLHYKYINPDVFVAKQQVNRKRTTQKQRQHSWGVMCLKSDASQREEFQRARAGAIKIL